MISFLFEYIFFITVSIYNQLKPFKRCQVSKTELKCGNKCLKSPKILQFTLTLTPQNQHPNLYKPSNLSRTMSQYLFQFMNHKLNFSLITNQNKKKQILKKDCNNNQKEGVIEIILSVTIRVISLKILIQQITEQLSKLSK